jgi:hypothetical protein
MHLPAREISRHVASAHPQPTPIPILEGDDPVAVAIAFVARQSDGPGKILRLHTCAPDAYCSACRVRPVRWPCPAAAIALCALEMDRANRRSYNSLVDPRQGRDS